MGDRPLLGKVLIKGKILCETGLHIGAARESLEIGGIETPVLRDPITREPYISGSSLKGKLRALLERKFNGIEERGKPKIEFNRNIGTRENPIWIHVCKTNAKGCPICRVFGSTAEKGEGENFPARLIVRDARLSNKEELEKIDTGLQYTEWKFENALDRVTAASNPRQLERVPAGAEFEFEMVYNVENSDKKELADDLNNILDTMNLLMDDYLGGHGSRGYGKINFKIESFEARKIDFYAAITDEERRKALSHPLLEVNTVTYAKSKIEELLHIFGNEG